MSEVQLTGRVVRPGDPAYDNARKAYNARFDIFPKVIVFAQCVDDVVNAVKWARDHGVCPSMRSGRHSYEAFSLVQEGIVIDVSALCEVDVNLEPDGKRGWAKVGAGIQLYPLYERLWQDRVTVPGGSCPTVGIAGLTLGGGLGLLGRSRGLTCDKLLGLDLVDAQGQVLCANAGQHNDLYWASRGGGGGNFGVVTSFTFQVEAIDRVAVYNLTWPWETLTDVTEVWQNWAPSTDRRLFSILKLNSASTGIISSIGQFEGSAGELCDLLQPLLQVGQPKIELHEVPYIDAVRFFAGIDPLRLYLKVHHDPTPNTRFKNTSAYAKVPISAAGIAVIHHFLSSTPNERSLLQLDSLGGAIADVPAEATAFFHRAGNLFSLQYQAYWNDDNEGPANLTWVEDFRRALLPYVSNGAYRNYCDVDIQDWPQAYYGANFKRLVAVKKRYDPDNIFSYAQSIPPTFC